MNKIEKKYFDSIENNICLQGSDGYKQAIRAAKKSTEITEQIAIEFLEFYERTARLSFDSTGEHHGKSLKEIYHKFLKTKQ